jgi:GNAT superfamily N-acetyltransferase
MTAGPASLEVVLRVSVELSREALAELFAAAGARGAGPRGVELTHSLCWVSAHVGERLVGFVNVAWDGGARAFLLDTSVHPELQRRGIGRSLVRCAADEARELGAEWLHVDYEPQYAEFDRRCGFRPALAGAMHLTQAALETPAHTPPALRKYTGADAAACRSLMAGLGAWFATTAAEAYLADLERVPTWVAVRDDSVAGFVSVTRSAARTFEVHVLAVAAERHGQGIGRALMHRAERWAAALGARFMQVKTLGPSQADLHYEKTRAFYLHLGYEPLFETDRLWGEGNPTLVLVKAIA